MAEPILAEFGRIDYRALWRPSTQTGRVRETAVALLHRESSGDAKRKGVNSHAFGAPNAHTDCFMVSGSKVLEGYGKYVAMAVGEKSFNGRIMMGMYFHILSRFHIPSASIPQQPPVLFVPFTNYFGFLQLPHTI